MENGKRRTENGKWRTNQFSAFRFPFSVLLLCLLLSSCKPEINIYADYKEIPIVYGLIDVNDDTNFVRINRAFYVEKENSDDINGTTILYDSCNFPGKLNAYFEELISSQGEAFHPTGRKLVLDTLTKRIKLYYTTERFNTSNSNYKYRYKLYVITPDADTATSETGIVKGDITINTPTPDYVTNTPLMNFKPLDSDEINTLDFSSTEEAVLYEIVIHFNYREGHTGQPLVKKEVSWSYGLRHLLVYESIPGSDFYRLYYPARDLFKALELAIGNDTVWDMNHPNVVRYYDGVDVAISAAGEEFYNYYQLSELLQQDIGASLEYSNINGGYGILSSRTVVRNTSGITPRAKVDLFQMPWGFREQ